MENTHITATGPTKIAALFISASLVCSCSFLVGTSRLELDGRDTNDLVSEYEGNEFLLASSMYVGEFFGEGKYLLADPRPFEILEFRDRSGDRLEPPTASKEIVFAGTKVRVAEIIFPQGFMDALFDGRGPNAHTWIVLERDEGKPLIVVLPLEIESAREFRAMVHERFASRQRVEGWLDRRDFTIARHIRHKELSVGMCLAEMVATLGRPRALDFRLVKEGVERIADYGNIKAVLAGDIITKIIDEKAEAAREAEQKAAQLQERNERLARQRELDTRVAEREAEERRWREAEMDRQKRMEAEERAAASVAKERREKARLAQAEQERIARKRAEALIGAEREKRQTAALDRAARKAEKRASRVRKVRHKLEMALANIQETHEWVMQELGVPAETAAVELQQKREALQHAQRVAQQRLTRAREDLAAAEAAGYGVRKAERALTRAHDYGESVRKRYQPRADASVEKLARAQELLTEQLDIVEQRRRKIERQLDVLSNTIFGLRVCPLWATPRDATVQGAVIVELDEDGRAEAAGLMRNDIIVAVEGQPVSGPSELSSLADKMSEDTDIEIEVWRNGGRRRLTLPGHRSAPANRVPIESLASR